MEDVTTLVDVLVERDVVLAGERDLQLPAEPRARHRLRRALEREKARALHVERQRPLVERRRHGDGGRRERALDAATNTIVEEWGPKA